jgi:hypothetical protein
VGGGEDEDSGEIEAIPLGAFTDFLDMSRRSTYYKDSVLSIKRVSSQLN